MYLTHLAVNLTNCRYSKQDLLLVWEFSHGHTVMGTWWTYVQCLPCLILYGNQILCSGNLEATLTE